MSLLAGNISAIRYRAFPILEPRNIGYLPMPTKRTKQPRHLRARVTAMAKLYVLAGRWLDLRRELGLKP